MSGVAAFAPATARFAMEHDFFDAAQKRRVILMVSRFGQPLNDLLNRRRIGALPIDIVGVVCVGTYGLWVQVRPRSG